MENFVPKFFPNFSSGKFSPKYPFQMLLFWKIGFLNFFSGKIFLRKDLAKKRSFWKKIIGGWPLAQPTTHPWTICMDINKNRNKNRKFQLKVEKRIRILPRRKCLGMKNCWKESNCPFPLLCYAVRTCHFSRREAKKELYNITIQFCGESIVRTLFYVESNVTPRSSAK